MKPNKIIFMAHDFSLASRNALEVAAAIAQKSGSKLFIYHVVSASVLTDTESVYTYSPDLDIKKASALIRRGITYLKKKFPNTLIAFEVDYGFLVPTITSKIEELNPWVSIFGVKKRTGLDKVIFGDVCTTMIGKIKSSMLVVPLNVKSLDLDTVVYAWDGKSVEVHQLNPLRDMLGFDASNIVALNVSHYDDSVEKHAANFKFSLKKMFPSQHTDLKMVQGLDKEVEFEKAIKKIKPDLLVIYAHHYSIWQSIFHKRFSRYALKFSQSPVLIVS
ncbi:MAG: universal stress protein [Bacteroidia bacterium]|nr:universal stress protein [Bacteroidia bacterium]